MLDIDPNFMCHKFVILPHERLEAQRKRTLKEEHHTIDQEVNKLLKTNFI